MTRPDPAPLSSLDRFASAMIGPLLGLAGLAFTGAVLVFAGINDIDVADEFALFLVPGQILLMTSAILTSGCGFCLTVHGFAGLAQAPARILRPAFAAAGWAGAGLCLAMLIKVGPILLIFPPWWFAFLPTAAAAAITTTPAIRKAASRRQAAVNPVAP